MSRWIEYDDAIERLGAYLMADAQIEWGGTASEDIEDWKELATDILKGSPSIDIVRCKECRRWEMRNSPRGWCVVHQGYVSPQYFCADGERKDNE